MICSTHSKNNSSLPSRGSHITTFNSKQKAFFLQRECSNFLMRFQHIFFLHHAVYWEALHFEVEISLKSLKIRFYGAWARKKERKNFSLKSRWIWNEIKIVFLHIILPPRMMGSRCSWHCLNVFCQLWERGILGWRSINYGQRQILAF